MKLGISIPVVLATVFTAGMASASTVTLRYDGATASPKGAVTITSAPVTPAFTNAGAYGFNMTDTTGNLGSFVAWCLDISHSLKSSATYFVTDTPFSNSFGLSDTEKSRVQSLFDANYASLNAGDRDEAASFQVALWNSLYDNDTDVFSGDFSATGRGDTDLTLANGYLAAASQWRIDGNARAYNLTFLESTSGNDQNFVTASAVPVPAAGLLLVTALGGIGVIRRRRKAA